MSNLVKCVLLRLIALAVSVVPPLIATLSYFPLWHTLGSGAVVSGLAILLLTLGAVPAIRYIKRFFHTPTTHLMWLLIFLAFFLLEKIAAQMKVISLIGFICNMVGAVIFRIARHFEVA